MENARISRSSSRACGFNRLEGSVSVIDLATRKEAAKWKIPGGGSPDMGGVRDEQLWHRSLQMPTSSSIPRQAACWRASK